ncbi:hypothetical protein [Brevibacterium sp. FAM 24638]|uniref:hypothetical protein n=1 Tax=Brevibacterium sp. FAM 24638 TaxID=3415681 RepID=UPI003C7CBE59
MQPEQETWLKKNLKLIGLDPVLTPEETAAATIAYGKAGSEKMDRLPPTVGFGISGVASIAALAISLHASGMWWTLALIAICLFVIPVVIVPFLSIRRAGEWEAVEAVQVLRAQHV